MRRIFSHLPIELQSPDREEDRMILIQNTNERRDKQGFTLSRDFPK